MSRFVRSVSSGLAVLTYLTVVPLLAAARPGQLPLLLPPAAKPDADRHGVVPPASGQKGPEPQKAEPKAELLRVPVEFRIPIADLEKQMLKTLFEVVAPGKPPALPVVVLGTDKRRAVNAEPILGNELPLPSDATGTKASEPRRQLIPRKPGERPILDRLAQRPLVAALAGRLAERLDTSYRVELRSFRVAVTGSTLTTTVGGGLHIEGPDPQRVRDLPLKLTIRRELTWADDGRLTLVGGESRVEIDSAAEIIGFPRLNLQRVELVNLLLGLVNGAVDRELSRRISTDKLPDLRTIPSHLKQKLPALALAEVTAFPVRGDGDDLVVALVVGLVPAKNGSEPKLSISTDPGPPPPPVVRGRIVTRPDGQPDVKLETKP